MLYEITIRVELDKDADYYQTEDEMLEVYELVNSAINDIDDLKIIDLEVLKDG